MRCASSPRGLLPLFPVLLGLVVSGAHALDCPQQEHILPCRCLVRNEEYQIWCSHSELPRVLEGLKSIAQHIRYPIDELILENNNLPSLPGRVFHPLKILRLMLRNNRLERVSNDWLSSLESSLVELFIVEPILRSFPEDSLDQMNALEAVTIQSELLKRLPRFSHLPHLKHLQIESKSLIELNPRHFRALPALEKFHVSNSLRLTRLENGLLQDLPSLAMVNISYCGLTIIHPRALTRLPALTELILTGNKITDAGMVGRACHDLPALSSIRLDHNNLNRLAEASFVDLPGLKSLYLCNNRILELHHGAFHRVPVLRMLDLNHNLIRRIHPDSFLQHSGSGIEELSMIDNDITHITELRSLLNSLPRLVFLDMSRNHLQEIPFGALRGHPTLERLHLDNNKIRIVEREAFTAMPALRELRLRNNSLSNLLDVPLWNLPSLKGLDLAQNYFRRLEPRLLSNLPSLRRIDLSENQIVVVDPVTFLDTPALEYVNLSYNALTSVHPATFRHLMSLYELDVNYNKLIEFVPGLPRGLEHLYVTGNQIVSLPLPPSPDLDLPALRTLDVSSNLIRNVPPDSMRTLPQLRRLFMSNNYLEHLEDGCMEGLARMEILNLSNNKLLIIHPNALQEMSELRELYVQSNRLELLRPELFRNLNNLKKLDVSHNFLSTIMNGTLDTTRNLQIVDASENRLTDLSETFKDLKHLRTLDLTNNKIQDVKSDVLNTLTSLSELKVSKNMIRELRRGALKNLPFLKTLHLDNNDLEIIDSNAIHNLPSLNAIKLNQNKLQLIPDGTFNKLPMLEIAELQDNKLVNIGKNAFFQVPHLLFLNLSNNLLPGIEEVGLRSINSLEVLDLSFNRITRIVGSNLEKMEWLVELKLDNNEICGVHGSPFSDMPRLRVLSLRNNRMMVLSEGAVESLRGNIAVLDIDGNPIMCSCSMLWLRAWLQEAGTVGPHCSDGTLLREMRLSRQDCSSEQRTTDPVAPGCEAELLSVPSYSTSQVFSQWMDLKEQTTPSSKQNNKMAPSPEESEYFYDEYVDYPFNETIIAGNNTVSKIHPKNTNVQSTTPKSSHYISGDTPTIYAASNKNKTIVQSPIKGASPSPSSSGFTFFGVPLPALNNLWPLGNKAADRKTDARDLSGRRNFYPLSTPQIQTGGFRPILPGSGGFVPMTPLPEVNYSRSPIINHSPESVTNYTHSIDRISLSSTMKPVVYNQQVSSTPIPIVATELPQKSIPRQQLTKTRTVIAGDVSASIGSLLENVTEIPENITNADVEMTTQKVIKNSFDEQTYISITTETVVTPKVETTKFDYKTTESSIIETASSYDDFHELFRDVVENVSLPISSVSTLTSTEIPTQKSTTEVPKLVTLPTSFTNVTHNNDTPTSLSALLVPGGQQPSYRPPLGRSTITKVISPHVTSASPQIVAKIERSTTHNSNLDIELFTTTRLTPRDESTNWYFMNYNKSNLQPYIDPALYNYAENGQDKLKYSVILTFVLVTIVLY